MQFSNSNWSGQVLIWSLNGPKVLTSFQAHDQNIPCIAFSPDGRYLATASADGSVKIWDVAERMDEARHELLKIDAAEEVSRLAEVLKRNTPRSLTPAKGTRVYMRDLHEATTTLIADTSERGLPFAEAPDWSHDGRGIVFRAKATADGPSRIILLESRGGRPSFHDLGSGDNPRFSPDDKSIAFLLWSGSEEDLKGGVWLMNADGTNRRRVAEFGAPFWSPDGTQLLINGQV
jgi:Tol biopolymer transport system component